MPQSFAAQGSRISPAIATFFRHYWPLFLIVCTFTAYAWMGQLCASLAAQCKTLKVANAALTQSGMRQAQEAFESGDFRKADVLMRSVQLSLPDDPALKFLRARILECNGRFGDAANAYERLYVASGDAYSGVKNALQFCRRMATERNVENGVESKPTREVLYRLHEELMQRGDISSARAIAMDLLPDLEPLRASSESILRQSDNNAVITPYAGGERMDVRVNSLNQQTLDLLNHLPIHSLTAKDSGITMLGIFSNLDIQVLNISRNHLGDINSLRTLPLSSLDISDCPVADIQPLAGLPLHTLNLSHTNVSSIYPLILCPLEELGLAGLPIRDLSPLRNLSLRSLDLAHTRVDDISGLARLPLETLHLDSTKVRNLTPLAGTRLKCLTISNTPVNDISPLAGMPLQILDLRGCTQLTDLTPLIACTKLEELHLPKGAQVPPALLHLPKLRIISH